MPRKSKPPVVTEPTGRCHDTMPAEWARAGTDLLAIDPGLQGTGVAVWEEGKLILTTVLNVPSNGRNWSWPARADYLADGIAGYSSLHGTVVCEYPEAFGGVKMMGWKTGDLQKLAYLVGLFAGRVAPARFVPVPVHVWKGQLPKHVVEERLTRRLGLATVKRLDIRLHAWDAVGIGMWARGEF